MLHPKCPWCDKKVSTYQLGGRRPKTPHKWYQFTRLVSVCPYCNNPVQVDQKSIRWVLLALPMFLFSILRATLGADVVPLSPYGEIGFVLATLGVLMALVTMSYKKSDDL